MTILLMLFCFVFPSHAGNTADEAELNFQLAGDAYRAGDFEQALFHFMVSNRLSPNRNVTYNIGRTYHALRRYPEAYRWYQDALNSEEETNERITRQIQRAIDALRPQVALLRVETDPPGATVYLNRRNLGAVGTTPLEVPVDPATYTVILELAGHEDAEMADINLRRPGASEAMTVSLTPILGQVEITGESGATVHVGTEDSPSLCEIPCTVGLPEGTQILYFKKPGFRSLPSLIDVVRGDTTAVPAELLPITGTVVVDADERGALIEIDGKPVGYTPAVLTDVQVGAHTLRVSSRGFEPFEAPISVQEDETLDLGNVMMSPRNVVTAASRLTEQASEAPGSITVITADELRAFGYQTVAEAINGVRGIYTTYDEQYRSVGIRGFNPLGDNDNRVLLTMDGHRINDNNLFGAALYGADFMVDLDDVEQIEVVRGPGSATYGSNALFGVINVVTKGKDSGYRPHVSVTGLNQEIRGRVGAGIGNEDAGAWFSVSGMYDPGETFVYEEYADSQRGGVSEGADEHYARTLSGKAWIGNFTVQAMYNGREKEIPNGAFAINLGDHRATTNDYRGFLEARYQVDSENTRFDARVAYDFYRNRGDFPYPATIFEDQHRESWLTASAQLNQDVGDAFTFTLGAETRQDVDGQLRTVELDGIGGDEMELEQPVDFDIRIGLLSAYGVADVHLGEWFRLNVGARYDLYNSVNDEFDLDTFNPRGALILTPGNETIKLIGGTAFRAPTAFEQLYDDGTSIIAPDEPLEPETIRTVDLEWTHAFSEVLTSTVDVFYNDIDKIIIDEAAGAVAVTPVNQAVPARTAGAEVELRRFWRSGWMFAVQASYQRTRFNDLNSNDPDDVLANSPVFLGSFLGAAPLGGTARLATKIRGESVRRTGFYERTEGRGERYTDGALIWDVTLTGRVERPDLTYGIGVRNLLGWPEFHPGSGDVIIDQHPQPGRHFFATLRADF